MPVGKTLPPETITMQLVVCTKNDVLMLLRWKQLWIYHVVSLSSL